MNIFSNFSAAGLTVVFGILVLGVLVFVHELGHFLVAKWIGVRVLTFSLGFGTPLWKKTMGGTEYRISAIPFGGYVHMAGENPEEESKGAPDEFTSKPVWQRAMVALAGPVANILFSLLLLWVYFMLGVDRPLYLDNPTIGAVMDTSAAQMAGFQAGDSIVAINGKPVDSWTDIEQTMATGGTDHTLSVVRNSTTLEIPLSVERPQGAAIPTSAMGGLLPMVPPKIGEVLPDAPAEKAGVKGGDVVLRIDGDTVVSWFQVSEMVSQRESPNDSVRITVRRDGQELTYAVAPSFDEQQKRYVIGIKNETPPSRVVRYGPVAAIQPAFGQAWKYTTLVYTVVEQLVRKQVSPRQLAGPLGIVQMSGSVARVGIRPTIDFMALIGINLAILNLLPLVITDGGLLLFLLIEAIRGRPLPLKTQMAINRVAIVLFIMLFLFVTFNDILRVPQLFRAFR